MDPARVVTGAVCYDGIVGQVVTQQQMTSSIRTSPEWLGESDLLVRLARGSAPGFPSVSAIDLYIAHRVCKRFGGRIDSEVRTVDAA